MACYSHYFASMNCTRYQCYAYEMVKGIIHIMGCYSCYFAFMKMMPGNNVIIMIIMKDILSSVLA